MSENVITMVFTDLVSSTAIKLQLPGRDITECNRIYRDTILLPHRQRVVESLSAYEGRQVEIIGDAFFLVFPNPIQAVQWAVAIQMSHINDPIPTPVGSLGVTIGMHTGSPLADGDRFIGHEVDYAARVAALATGGQILLSEATEVLVRLSRSTDWVMYRHSDRNLKGIGSVPIFELLYNNKQPQPLKGASASQQITNIPQAVSTYQSVISEQKEKEKPTVDLNNKSTHLSALTNSENVLNLAQATPTNIQTPSSELTLPKDIQKQLEKLLANKIGPMAAFVLQQTIDQVSTPQDLLKQLTMRVPERLRKQFQEEVQTLLQLQVDDLPVNTHIPAESPVTQPTINLPTTTAPTSLEPIFVQLCQIELAKSIGPMATLIVQQTLSLNPALSQSELVETLAKQIPIPQKAQEFRQRLMAEKP